MNSAALTKKYIPSLTSIRAIAAFMVFLHHYNFIPTFNSKYIELFIFQGYTGVSLFFILSGFLIHRNYVEKFENFKWSFLKTYFINRFARVYPMYFLLASAALIYLNVHSFYFWFINLSLIKGFSNVYKFQLISTTWSLTVEECFYFAFPILVWFRLRKIPYLLILSFIYLIGYLLFLIGDYYEYQFFMYPENFVIIYTFFGRALEFILGMLASELLYKNSLKLFKTPVYTYIGILGSLATLGTLTYIASLETNTPTPNKVVAMFSTDGLLVHHFILPVFFDLVILGLAIENSFIQKILSLRFFELLGKSSYIFYLLQGVMFNIFLYKVWPNPDPISIFLTMTISSILLFLFIEDPLNRLIRRLPSPFEEIKKLKLLFKF